MPDTKETTEIIRAAGMLLAKFVARSADGEFSRWDGFKVALSSVGDVWDAIAGASAVLSELRDLTPEESEALITEIESVLAKSQRFTHRQRDSAKIILQMVYRDVVAISQLLSLPPTAEPVP